MHSVSLLAYAMLVYWYLYTIHVSNLSINSLGEPYTPLSRPPLLAKILRSCTLPTWSDIWHFPGIYQQCLKFPQVSSGSNGRKGLLEANTTTFPDSTAGNVVITDTTSVEQDIDDIAYTETADEASQSLLSLSPSWKGGLKGGHGMWHKHFHSSLYSMVQYCI